MPISPLETVVRRTAADKLITRAEAKKIVAVAKETTSRKQIDDVFQAIDKAGAALDEGATRLILGELDQKLSRAQWVAYAQKATSGQGVWATGTEGGVKMKRADLPPAVRRIFDSWVSSGDTKPEVTKLDIAGKPVFLIRQFDTFIGALSLGLFDESGRAIEHKQDTKNVQRLARRIQGMYDGIFKSPEMRGWATALQHTDVGVMLDYRAAGESLVGSKRTSAMSTEMKRVERSLKPSVSEGHTVELFKSSKDGSYLMVASGMNGTSYALFSKKGLLVNQYSTHD